MDNKSWLQEWGWEPRRYKITLIGWVLVCVMALPAALFFGSKGMLILAFPVIVAVVTASLYGTIGSKVAKTRSGDSDGADAADGIIVQGWLQSPGTVVLKDGMLLLRPIAGGNVSVRLDDIEGVREVSYFNGHFYDTKRGFWLDLTGVQRYGFAVANPTAGRWRPVLMNRMHARGKGAKGS